VTIISDQCFEIKKVIVEKLGRGVTVYNGKSGFGKRGEVMR
jgi:PII-like signaling protein